MIVLLCALSGCGRSKHEAAVDDAIAIGNELCDILDGVKDKDSAQAAAGKIEKLGSRMKDLSERIKAMGEPSKEEQEKIGKKLDEQSEKLKKRMEANQAKFFTYPVLLEALMKVGKEMEATPQWFRNKSQRPSRFENVGGSLPPGK
jgi:predicted RNase H-like nuclease (RuvC/YqgF family)